MPFKRLLAIAALLAAPFAQAAYVTIDEPGMETIFGQQAFGNNKIDIRVGAVTQIVAPNLLDITTAGEISDVFGLHVGGDLVVNFYFVDSIDACGNDINANFIGCGETPGNDFVVESDFAANPATGALLLSHELGHNLGLGHNVDSSFLMYFALNGGSLFSASEVAAILASPLVKQDTSGQRYIDINPVLILAQSQTVPEPASIALVLGALALVGANSRQRKIPA